MYSFYPQSNRNWNRKSCFQRNKSGLEQPYPKYMLNNMKMLPRTLGSLTTDTNVRVRTCWWSLMRILIAACKVVNNLPHWLMRGGNVPRHYFCQLLQSVLLLLPTKHKTMLWGECSVPQGGEQSSASALHNLCCSVRCCVSTECTSRPIWQAPCYPITPLQYLHFLSPAAFHIAAAYQLQNVASPYWIAFLLSIRN